MCRYGYGLQLWYAGGELVVLGHNGLDPGVAAVVAHHLAGATTIVVLGNQDRGSWPVYLRLAAELGLPEEDRWSEKQTRRSPAEVSRLVRHRALVAVAGRIGQYRQVAGPAGRSAVGRHP